MSSRHMKKVFGSEQDVLNAERVSDDDGPGPVAFKRNKAFPLNPYQVLDEGSDSETKEDESHEAEKDSEKDDEQTGTAQSQRKKKKKKRKNKKNLSSDDATTTSSSSSGAKKSLQDIKKIIARQNVRVVQNTVENEEQRNRRILGELFSLDPKFVNHEYELRRIFGTKVINQELGASGNRRYRSPGKLIAAREKWPIVTGFGTGLSMELISVDDITGIEKYKFNHDAHYRELQLNFMRAVDSFDPNNIVSIVRVHPYHVDSQIQLAELSGEDKQVAAELIELAIHTMESAAHPKFYMCSSNARLEYKYQENRAFHMLLFKHLTFVGLRSTYRCALELCKRLLSLDPDNDPLAVTLLLDFYAIKAGECQWFCDLYNFWESKKNLSQLPNWAYSVALSQFLLSIDGDTNLGVSASVKSKKGDGAPKKLSYEEKEELGRKSDDLLQYSILMFPAVLLTLLQKCGIQCDSRVRNHSYFNSIAQNSSTESLKLLCDLYVWRSHHLWKDPVVLRWLERNANAALDKVDGKNPVVQDYDAKRRRRYQGTPRNIMRHILITDEKKLVGRLPIRDMNKDAILSYDLFPPPDGINIYQPGDHLTQGRNAQGPGQEGEPRGLLSSLFRSFMFDLNGQGHNINQAVEPQRVGGAAMRNRPVVQVPAPAQGNGDVENVEGAQGGIAGAAAGLHQSVAVLLDAMRDLLSTTNPTVRDGSDFSSDDEDNHGH